MLQEFEVTLVTVLGSAAVKVNPVKCILSEDTPSKSASIKYSDEPCRLEITILARDTAPLPERIIYRSTGAKPRLLVTLHEEKKEGTYTAQYLPRASSYDHEQPVCLLMLFSRVSPQGL